MKKLLALCFLFLAVLAFAYADINLVAPVSKTLKVQFPQFLANSYATPPYSAMERYTSDADVNKCNAFGWAASGAVDSVFSFGDADNPLEISSLLFKGKTISFNGQANPGDTGKYKIQFNYRDIGISRKGNGRTYFIVQLRDAAGVPVKLTETVYGSPVDQVEIEITIATPKSGSNTVRTDAVLPQGTYTPYVGFGTSANGSGNWGTIHKYAAQPGVYKYPMITSITLTPEAIAPIVL